MRRTTIFRSRGAVAAAAALVLGAAAVQAQDNPSVQSAAQLPEVHVVQTGETLWALSERYLGDPFLWPEIDRINTDVVEDPHWIFPGEELRLLQARAVIDSVTVVDELPVEEPLEVEELEPPPVAPAPPPTETAPTVFQESGPSVRTMDLSAPIFRYRPLRRGQFYSAGFLTEGEELPWAKVLGAVGTPTLRNLASSSVATVFDEVEIEAPESATYQIGDSLLVARVFRDVRGWGKVVSPTGIVRVTGTAGSVVHAEVIVQFHRVADGQFALPLEPFRNPGDVVPVPIENGATGEIVDVRDLHPVRQQQDIVFIDLGRSDGVSLGDVFEVFLAPEEGQVLGGEEPVGVLHIVHVRDRSASGFVINVMELGLDRGAPVRLVRKMPG
jgi:hypothetical protein